MGLLISINGADFQPYHPVKAPNPLVKQPTNSQAVAPIHPKLGHPTTFQKALSQAQQNKARSYSKPEGGHEKISKKAIYAKDLMSRPVTTLTKNTKINLAKNLLKEKQIRHIPIVNDANKIIGIISNHNLTVADDEAFVSEIMTQKIIVAQPTTRLQEIARAMIEQKINSVPILDKEQCVVGIVTSSDLLASVFKNPNIDLWV